MSLGTQSALVMLVTLVLYVAVPAILLIKGWTLRAGLAMLVVTFLPLLWQGLCTDSSALGFGILLFLMLPLSLVLIAAGGVVAVYRSVSKLIGRGRTWEW